MIEKIDEVRVKAPAKVNLILKVLGRLPNGYHELWSIMQAVDLFDHLYFRHLPSSRGIRLICKTDRVPTGKDNLVYRAAELVLKKANLEEGLEISLEKHIPMGAGLGGGSSDAAATIFGLVQLFQLKWSLSEMADLGAGLGSDIPFFFHMPQALIRGWGHEVVPLSITGSRWVLLVYPNFPTETGWAYQRLSMTRKQVPVLSRDLTSIEKRESIDLSDLLPLMENDFEPALFPTVPRLQEIRDTLLFWGAEVALLSGSGSTVFGVFSQGETAAKAMQAVSEDVQLKVFCVRTGSKGFSLAHD